MIRDINLRKILWIYLFALALVAFSFHSEAAPQTEASATTAEKKADTKPAEKKADAKVGPDKKAETKAAKSKFKKKDYVVVIDTSMGKIEVKLDGKKAPETTENFLKYVDDKFYDGTIFHRVISTFMIQGGGMTPDMKEKETRAPIKNEAKNGLSNERGTISMARTMDINSASAQFFINVVNNPRLDYKNENEYGYAVFGKVISGMDVVDKIKAVQVADRGEHEKVPVEPVVIKSIVRK